MFKCIQHVVLEQLLIGHANLDGHTGGAVLAVPAFDKGYVDGTATAARAQVEGPRGPEKGDAISRVV